MNSSQVPTLPYWEQPESRRLEFKEQFPKGAHVAKTIIAFANGAGGKIIFGVQSHPRQIIGIPDNELFLLEERISNHIFSQCTPTIIPEIELILQEAGYAFQIQFRKKEATGQVPDKPRSSKQRYIITPKGLEELKRESGKSG